VVGRGPYRGGGQPAFIAAEAAAVTSLDAIPGVARRTAETIVAGLGCDMSRLPTAGHAASWAGLCPGNHESAGKRLSGRTRFANRVLRQTLVETPARFT
jgi:transposase